MCAFKQVLRRAEIPETFRFHDLRHACATFLIVMGIHPRVVMEILGHSQIGTTMNIYAHVLPRIQRDAVNSLDGLFGETPDGGQVTGDETSAPVTLSIAAPGGDVANAPATISAIVAGAF